MILLLKEYWELKKTNSKGRGVFAKIIIPKGTLIGDYAGKVIHPQDAIVDDSNFYLIYYHDTAAIAPDLKKTGVHLLNHSCVPNAFLYIYKGHTLVFALREILFGEELTIPYLLPPIDSFCNPCHHVCKCGSKKCRGTMHLSRSEYDQWRKLSDSQSRKTKRLRIRYGEELPKLISYPLRIPEDYTKKVAKIFNY